MADGFWIGFAIGMLTGAVLWVVLFVLYLRVLNAEARKRRENIECDVLMQHALRHGRKFSMTVSAADDEDSDE